MDRDEVAKEELEATLKASRVAETVLKKRKVQERAQAAKRAEDILAAQKNYKRPRKGELQYKSAESFVTGHRNERKAVTRARRNGKTPVEKYMKDAYNDQLLFVIRVRGMNALEVRGPAGCSHRCRAAQGEESAGQPQTALHEPGHLHEGQ